MFLALLVVFKFCVAFADDAVLAAAWDGVRVEDLGRLYTKDFQPITVDARSIVVPATPPVISELGSTDREFRVVATAAEVQANAKAWGIGSASLGTGKDTTYAVYRAIDKIEYRQVDDTRLVPTEVPEARYYIHAVYFGRMYEVGFWGEQSHVAAALSASGVAYAGGIDAWAKENSLEYKIRTVGFRARESSDGSALFARTDVDVEKMYEAAGDPRPILVEFREVPKHLRVGLAAPSAVAATDVDVMTATSVSFEIGEVIFPKKTRAGADWDAFNIAPDISVWVKLGGVVVYQSPVATDAYSVKLNTRAVENIDPTATPTIVITASDEDLSDSDLAGRWEISLPALGRIPIDGWKTVLTDDSGLTLEVAIVAVP
jgi:hypothetical protein